MGVCECEPQRMYSIVGKLDGIKIWRFVQFLILAIFYLGEIAAAINDVTEEKKIWLKLNLAVWPLIIKLPN